MMMWWYVDGTIYHHFALPANATTPAVFLILQVSLGICSIFKIR